MQQKHHCANPLQTLPQGPVLTLTLTLTLTKMKFESIRYTYIPPQYRCQIFLCEVHSMNLAPGNISPTEGASLLRHIK